MTMSQQTVDSTIFNIPDLAETILNKCTVNDPNIKNPYDVRYEVLYNYEFIEDTNDSHLVSQW